MTKQTTGKRDKAAANHLLEAFRVFSETGKSESICEECQTVIQFQKCGDDAYECSCVCGRYTTVLKGI